MHNYYCHLTGKDSEGVKTWMPLNVEANSVREAKAKARAIAEASGFKIRTSGAAQMPYPINR